MKKSAWLAFGCAIAASAFFQLSADEVDSAGEPIAPPDEDPPDEMVLEEPDAKSPLRIVPANSASANANATDPWVAQGPGPARNGQVENISPNRQVVGAVHVVLPHPTNADILYLAGTNGGIWKTMNATAASPTWTPLTDDQPSLAIGALEFDPTDPTFQTLVAGIGSFSSFGRLGGSRTPGMLRSTDGGTTWTAINPSQLNGETCSGIAARGNILLAAANEFSGAGGLYRSTTTGSSWSTIDGGGGTGLPNDDVHDLVGDPTNLTRFYLTLDQNGIYRSNDTGATWTEISDSRINTVFGSGSNNNAEMAVSPLTGRLYLAILNSGQTEYIGYTDNPTAGSPTWVEMDIPTIPATGAPTRTVTNATNATPIVITTSVAHGYSSGNWVEVAGVSGNTAANGIFRVDSVSTTQISLRLSAGNGAYTSGGTTVLVDGVNPRDKPGGQGSIHYAIAADPIEANTFYIGGDRQDTPFPNFLGATQFSGNLWRGDTTVARGNSSPSPQWEHLTHRDDIAAIPGGGTSNSSSPHADSREIAFDANGDIIEGDDGGIYRRTSPRNNTGAWFGIAGNLQNTEIHDIAYDTISNIIVCGNQDTGTMYQLSPGSVEWNSVSTADGGDVAITVDPTNPSRSVRYSSFQNLGAFRRRIYDSGGTLVSNQSVSLTPINGSPSVSGKFVTPVEGNNVDPNRIAIAGSNNIYVSLDQGSTVDAVGPGTGSSLQQKALIYGGFKSGVGNANVLYFGTGSNVYHTSTTADAVATGFNGTAGTGTVRDVVMDRDDWETVFAIDDRDVFMSSNAGVRWTDISGNLPNLTVQALEYIRVGFRGAVVVGTANGVYAALDSDYSDWFKVGTGLPNAHVWDLDYDPDDDLLVVGTLGRGAWSFPSASAILFPTIVTINEVDSDTTGGSDTAEFVELHDGGDGNTALDGLVVVFFNGATDQSYAAFDLDGFSTDGDGFFLLGNGGVSGADIVFADGLLENGADAVAVYTGDAADFPNGTAVTTADIIDAVVYDTGQGDDAGLLSLLNAGQPQLDERRDPAGDAARYSLQRFPDGAGDLRNTVAHLALPPTPGVANALPPAPGPPDLTNGSDSGSSNTDDLTMNTTPVFTGTASPGSLVDLNSSINGYLGTGLTNGGGTWTITSSALIAGVHNMTASADGSAGSTALPVTIDLSGPAVTVNQAAGQADPTMEFEINFTAIFSEPATLFGNGDVSFSGTARPMAAAVTEIAPNDGTTYNLAVSGMTASGTVIPTIAAGAATDLAGNPNFNSTRTDNTVTFIKPPDPPSAVTATDGEFADKIVISWNIAPEAATGYEVFRHTADDFGGASSIEVTNLSTRTVEDDTSVPGTIYFYWVKSRDPIGGTGPESNSESGLRAADTGGQSPAAAKALASIPAGNTPEVGTLGFFDRDYFSFTLDWAAEVTISTTGNLNTSGSLFESNGVTLINDPSADRDAGAGLNFLIQKILPAGDYFIMVEGQNSIQSGQYVLNFDINGPLILQPDGLIGGSPASLKGDDVYNLSGASQTHFLASKKLRPVTFHGRIENDGETPEEFTMRGTKGNKLFRVTYFDDGGNVTAAMVAGTLLKNYADGAGEATRIQVKPSRKLKKKKTGKIKKKKFTATVTATSGLDGLKMDVTKATVKTK